jgi:hypothetical protein
LDTDQIRRFPTIRFEPRLCFAVLQDEVAAKREPLSVVQRQFREHRVNLRSRRRFGALIDPAWVVVGAAVTLVVAADANGSLTSRGCASRGRRTP